MKHNAFPSALRFTPLNVHRTCPPVSRFSSQNNPLGLFCSFILRVRSFILYFLLLLVSCQPEPRNAVPADETHIYSGTFRAIQAPFILVDGTEYPNQIGEAPIQITAEVKSDNLVFTIYGKDYGIYDVNFFVNHADCFEFNGSELLDFRVDDFGNEEIRVIFNEDFWMNERSRRVNVWETFKRVNRETGGMAYMDDDLEKVVGFVLKSEGVVF